jgi:hypothetical protein
MAALSAIHPGHGSVVQTAQMNMAERKYELAGERKKRQPNGSPPA